MPSRFLLRTSCLLGTVLAAASIAWSQNVPKPAVGGDENQVPLRKLVLFTSGVGYFEHAGTVTGDSSVEMRFDVEDINDLLKSMVLQDAGGGKVSTVTYTSRDPITRTLKTFGVDLTDDPTLAELLKQLRGKAVEVEAPQKITGKIIGVERRKRKVGDEVLEYDALNLLTEAGLKSLRLDEVASIRFLDAELNAEFSKALATLATSNDTDKKTVTLNFLGQGERPVRVGYVQEMPVWKTSYRLVLGDDGEPHLQGWAIVENTTEMDWSDVNLTLVSGRPISFRMDLYQPLYVNRPLVVPELYSSLTPKVYGQDLAEADKRFEEMAELSDGRAIRRDRHRYGKENAARAPMLDGQAGPGGLGGLGGGAGARYPNSASMDMLASVQSMANAAELGELFQYRIETPVTLSRQKSAMLPIVNAELKAEKLAIYNPSVHAKHPLNGLRFTNTTDLNLMQGPITVYDDGAYAGDSRIESIAPKASRLMTYAIDLDTEVAVESRSAPTELVSVKIVKGVLYSSRKYHREHHYTVKNSGSREKKVLIEQPFDANWKLVQPEKPTEKTRALYRFQVEAAPGEPEKLTVAEEMTQRQTAVLTNIPDDTVAVYLSARVVDDEVKDALREAMRRKQELSKLAAQRQLFEQQIQNITNDQSRIRQNMSSLSRNTELYNRYVKKFTAQEDEIENLRTRIAELQKQEQQKKVALDEFLANLTIE